LQPVRGLGFAVTIEQDAVVVTGYAPRMELKVT
jgi:hypothetical protein